MVLTRKPYLSNEGNIMLLASLEKINFHSSYLVDTIFNLETCKAFKNQGSIFILHFLILFSLLMKTTMHI
jgi:hypothetical protein